MWEGQLIVDNCDLDKWSKVEVKSICREFGYTTVDKLWFKMLGVNLEQANFHQVVDDDAVVFVTNLVKGYGEIHVFVEHPLHEPLELPVEDFEPLVARQPGSEPEGVDAKALEVFVSDSELQSDQYYEYAQYGDEEYKLDFSQFGGHDNVEFTNVDHGEPHEVDAEKVCAKRAGKAPVVDDQVEESSEDEESDLEEEPKMQPMNIGEDSTDSWTIKLKIIRLNQDKWVVVS